MELSVTYWWFIWRGIYSEHSDIKNKKIKIQKHDTLKPIVVIHNPHDGERNLSGIINIKGTATSEISEIQRVEIQFNNGKWENVTGTTSWHKNWDTNESENGQHHIKVRCIDINGTFNSSEIFVSVFNEEPDKKFEFPPFNGGLFQIFIPTKYELIKPGETHTIDIYHRRKEETRYEYINTIKTIIKIRDTTPWINIISPEDPIVTPPDNISYTYPIPISITNDAPKNIKWDITIYYTYRPALFTDIIVILNKIPFFDQLFDKLNPPRSEDVTISTGQW